MADDTLTDIDERLVRFNVDRTPGSRAIIMRRLMADTGLTYRAAFDLLVRCEWDEETARQSIQKGLFA